MNTTNAIKKKIAVGVVWMILQRIVVRGIGLISMMILARVLLPEDYGMIALAMSVYALLEILAAFGFDTILVQKKTVTREDYDSCWTARLICYVVLTVIFASCSGYVAIFYKQPELQAVIYALSINMLFSGLNNIALVDFRRELAFDKEFKYQLYVKLIGFCITVPLAFWLKNYWALVYGMLGGRFFAVLLGYWMRPYRPAICFTKIGEIMNFSKWILLTNGSQYLRGQLPNVIIGRWISASAVGLYSVSMEISRESTQALIGAMNRPVYSGFARLAHQPDELKKNYLEVLAIQALFILPIGFGMSATSDWLVLVALGSKWLDVIPLVSFAGIATVTSAIASSSQYIFLVKGKPALNFVIAMIGLLLFIPQLLFYTASFGLMGAIYALFITNLLMPIISFLFVSKALNIGFDKLLSEIIRPLFAAIFMYFVHTRYVADLLANTFDSSVIVRLLMAVVIGAVIYFATVLLLWLVQGRPNSIESRVGMLLLEKASGFGRG